jgi:tetratricopeptide (TPR) repeat protein
MMRLALFAIAGTILGCGGAAARWVDDAAAIHAQVDASLREGQLARARSLLEQFVSRPAPASVAGGDRRAVLQDAWGRLALVALREGSPAQALRYADAGLALGEDRDVFSATLRTLRGRAGEALGRDADAARDYEAAQIIDEALLAAALSGRGAR